MTRCQSGMPLLAAMNRAVGWCVARRVQRFLSVVVCVWALSFGASARAQEAAAEPDPVAVETMRRVLMSERLKLTDAWMEREERLELTRLRQGRWWAFGFYASLSMGWGAVGVGLLTENVSPAWSYASFGVAATTLALAIAVRGIENHWEGSRWSNRLAALELGLMGAGLLASRFASDHSNDAGYLYVGLGAQMLAQATLLTLLHVFSPSLYVSEHFAGYRARTDSERAEYGLSLLLEREQRERVAAYTGFSMGVLNAAMYTSFAFAADRSEARPLFLILGASQLINATVNLVIQLVMRTPSDHILLGLPPPVGDKL